MGTFQSKKLKDISKTVNKQVLTEDIIPTEDIASTIKDKKMTNKKKTKPKKYVSRNRKSTS